MRDPRDFVLRLAHHRFQSIPAQYFLAIGVIVLATWLRVWLGNSFGLIAAYVTFYPAVLYVAISFGFWPGIFSVFLSALSAEYFFLGGDFGMQHPHGDDMGQVLFVLGGVLGVAMAENLRRMELRSRQSEERFRVALQNSPVVVFNQDLQLRYTWINSPIGPWSEKSWMGKTDAEIVESAADAEHLTEIKRSIIQTGKGVRMEISVHHKGQPSHYDFAGEPLRDSAGKVIGITCAVTDITERKRADEALRVSEEKYRSVVAAMSEGVVLQSADGTIMACNESAEEILGSSSAQLSGRTSNDSRWQAAHEDGSEFPGEQHPAMVTLQTGKPCKNVVMGILQPNGTRRWMEVSSQPLLKDGATKPYAVVTSFTDISERKKTELALRGSEEKFRKVFFTGPDAFFLTTLEEGRYVEINDNFSGLFGYSREEVVGTLSTDLNIVAPEDRRRVLEVLRKTGSVRDAEMTLTKKSGERLTALVSLTTLDIGGERLLLGVAKDITDRKRAQDTLVRLRHAVDASGEVVVMTDRDGIITFVNPEFTKVYGYTAEEVVGKVTPRVLKSGEVTLEQYARFWQSLLEGSVVQDEIVNRSKTMRKVTVQRTSNPVIDEKGEVSGFVSVQRDITRSRELEQQFMQAQKMEAVGQLAGGVAHDFNNLLGVIKGYTELMLDDASATESSKRQLIEIKKAADRAAEVTRQLLAFSRKQVLQVRELDLNVVIRDTSKMLARLLGEDIVLITKLAPDLGHIKADPTGIDQVIMNLAVNARDAMPTGGKLTIETSNRTVSTEYDGSGIQPGEYVQLTVADEGAGMDEETQRHIFEPFFSTKEKGRGTGLGLSTVVGIVEQCSGRITVESAIGSGSKFTILFPRVLTESGVAIPAVSGTAERGSGTVMLVEDDEGLRKLTTEMLEGLGYQVLAFENGEAAIAGYTAANSIRLLITDVIMPGINGQQLAERMRAMHPLLKVLFVSGYTEHELGRRILGSGGILLQKPFDRASLAGRIRELLEAKN